MSLVTLTVISLLWLWVVNKAVQHSCLVQTLVYSETLTEFYLLLLLSGKRICPGEGLARMEIFLVIATIMQNFTLKSVVSPQELDTTPTLSGTGNVPPAYQLRAVPRWKALNHAPVSWNWRFLYILFTKINSRTIDPPFPGLALMFCHRITEHIKQLVLSPAQLLWLLPQHVSHQDHALQMESAACVYICGSWSNKQESAYEGLSCYLFWVGAVPNLLLHCRTGLQSLWPACCGKGCPFWARTLPFSKTVLTAAACKELQSSHSTPPVRKAQGAGEEGCPAACLPNERMHLWFLKAVARRSLTWGLETATNSLAGLFLPSVSLQGFRHSLLKKII